MASENVTPAPPTFRIVGLPVPMPVRDPETGQIVDGFRVTVKSLTSGATTTVDVPHGEMTPTAFRPLAERALAGLDATLVAFAPRTQG